MIGGLYKSAWGALASQIRHEVVANNMANVNTPGFRADWSVMRSFRNRGEVAGGAADPGTRVLWSTGGGGMVAETRTAHRAGPLRQTGVSTDVAILGNSGFFVVAREGQTRYTRAGNFHVDSSGYLVTADGNWRVQAQGGGDIQVNSPDFRVDTDGRIRRRTATGEEVVAQLGLQGFEDPARLIKTGDTMFTAPEAAGRLAARPESRIQQEALELSGANAAQTMVSMIEAMRSYEANMNFVRMQDQLLGRAVTEIARLGG
jgi:flagellar basal-body rod protein FlgG